MVERETVRAFPSGTILVDFNRAVQYIHYDFHMETMVDSAMRLRDFRRDPAAACRNLLLDLANLSAFASYPSFLRRVGPAQQPDLTSASQTENELLSLQYVCSPILNETASPPIVKVIKHYVCHLTEQEGPAP
jgi:hypothetical protein